MKKRRPSFERHECTAEEPYDPAKHERACHPAAKEVGECFEGCCVDYHCPVCGTKWREELPQ